MCISIYQNINITKKTCCIKIVPTDCFACEAHQRTQQLKKATLFTVKPLIERHPVFFKNRRKRFTNPDSPAVTIASSKIHFLLFFFFYSMLMLTLKEGFRVSFTAKRNRLRRLLEETGWR